jgi:hypothetical protein
MPLEVLRKPRSKTGRGYVRIVDSRPHTDDNARLNRTLDTVHEIDMKSAMLQCLEKNRLPVAVLNVGQRQVNVEERTAVLLSN